VNLRHAALVSVGLERQTRQRKMGTQVSAKKEKARPRRRERAEEVLRQSLVNFFIEDSLTVSASIAYYSLLAIFPLMLLILGVSSLYIRHYELSGRLAVVFERYLPIKADFFMRNLVSISRTYGRVTFLSFLLLLWSSSGVFLPLEKALNRAWKVEKGRRWWQSRLVALEMAVIVSFLMFTSSSVVGVNAYIHHLMHRWVFRHASGLGEFIYHTLILCATFSMTLAMFIVIYQRLPNRPMRARQVLPSALVTAIFWEAARSVFTLLLPIFNYRQVYGSIGAVVALMTWAYISSALTLFGAQVSHALDRTWNAPVGAETMPREPAVQSAALP